MDGISGRSTAHFSGKIPSWLNQPLFFEAEMPVARHDHVVENFDAQDSARIDDPPAQGGVII